MNTQRMTLDIGKESSANKVVYVGSGDHNGTSLCMIINDNGIPVDLYGMVASLRMRTSDGEAISVACTTSGSEVLCTLDEQVLRDRVIELAYVTLSGYERVYSTERFLVRVMPGYELP